MISIIPANNMIEIVASNGLINKIIPAAKSNIPINKMLPHESFVLQSLIAN